MPLHIFLGYHHNGAVFIYFVSLLWLANIQAAVQSALQTSFLYYCVAFLYLKFNIHTNCVRELPGRTGNGIRILNFFP